MKKIGIAMVVTHSGRGDALRARPMAAHPLPEENAIYFLTDGRAEKGDEVAHNTNVCLAFSDVGSQKYVSVTGRADISDDRGKIKQLWSENEKAFWRDENDPAIRVLRVLPEEAEYWDSSGSIVTYLKVALARLTSEKPNLHENEKVRLADSPSLEG